MDAKFRDAVVEYFKKFYEQHKWIPSAREVFKHFKKAEFYRNFPGGQAEVCGLAGLSVPEERIRRTEKAVQALKKKRVHGTVGQTGSLKGIQRRIRARDEQDRLIVKDSVDVAETIKTLFRQPSSDVSGPVRRAICEVMPEIMQETWGISVTVPRLVEMQKTYEKAKRKGWSVDDVREWAALPEPQRETFRELRREACDKGMRVSEYVESLKAERTRLSTEKEQLIRSIDELKRQERNLDERCSSLNRWLEVGYKIKEKDVETKLLEDEEACNAEFAKFKSEVDAKKSKVQKECKDWETKLENFIDEYEKTKKQAFSTLDQIDKSRDKSKAEMEEAKKKRDEVSAELKQLRALVGPEGTVADLARQRDELNAQLEERDRRLAEKAVEEAGKWLNQEEALRVMNEEGKRVIGEVEGACRLVADEVERQIENAGHGLRVLEFLESGLSPDEFTKLTFAVELTEVKRESLNPDNPYFARLPAMKKELLGIFPTAEEYQRLFKEKMENVHKRREANLQKIREAADDIATKQGLANMLENLLENVRPIVESFFDPEKPEPNDSSK